MRGEEEDVHGREMRMRRGKRRKKEKKEEGKKRKEGGKEKKRSGLGTRLQGGRANLRNPEKEGGWLQKAGGGKGKDQGETLGFGG